MSDTKKTIEKPSVNEAQIPIPQTFTKDQVEAIVNQATQQLQQQVKEAGQLNQQLKQALNTNNTSEIYRRIGMLLELTKSPELFGEMRMGEWKQEILELVDDTKLIKITEPN